jgi:hypothetical protein
MRDSQAVQEGLDFILSHFCEPLFPRLISTKTTQYRQVLVNNREEALDRFRQSTCLDCRISAYDTNAYENPSAIARFQGIKTATPRNLIVMIDLDRCNFISEKALRLALNLTLRNIKEKLGVSKSTVIFSGRGYHVIQLLDANGTIFEYIRQFENVPQPSLKFLRFAESFLSNGKSDPSHNNTVSFGNMMLRIPGSLNSKNGQSVRVVTKCDNRRPPVNYLLRDFRRYLIDQRVRGLQSQRRRRSRRFTVLNESEGNVIHWIENLLRTPLFDFRKLTIWRILGPYLLNIRNISPDESEGIMLKWLNACSQLRGLDFNPALRIKSVLNSSNHFLPISYDKLRQEHKTFYDLLQEKGVLR